MSAPAGGLLGGFINFAPAGYFRQGTQRTAQSGRAVMRTGAVIVENKLSDTAILAERKSRSLPIMQSLENYFREKSGHVLPKSSIGMAIQYAMNMWARLKLYLDNPQMLIDNNLIENTIRPVALGRKNYLFAGSHEAAQRAAMIYTFLGTCKLNDVEPFAWLKETLEKIADYKIQNLKELLPSFKAQ
jgi:hypothetical protein